MEPKMNTAAPIVDSSKYNDGKGWKIATTIACIVAVCSIGFGVYGLIQVSNKDNYINSLKTQIETLELAKQDNKASTNIDTNTEGDMTINRFPIMF